MISSNTTAFGQDSSFLCGAALLQRIWHFGSKMFSFGKLCLEFEKCFINLARTFLSPITKMGIILTFSNQKGCCNVVRSVLLYFERKKIRALFLCQEGYFNCLILLSYQCCFTGADMRLYSKKSCETDLPSLYSMKI